MKRKRIVSIGLLLVFTQNIHSDEIVHVFKNPSFSGIGTSAHYLTIENQEKSRRDQIQDDIESALKAAEREKDNTTLAKFIRNLESRIYAQLSKQLVDSMFGEESGDSGTVTFEGTTISYVKDTENVALTILDANGSETIITVPIGDFTF